MQWTIPSFLGYHPKMHISFVSFQCRDNFPKYQQNWESNITLYIIYNQAGFMRFMKFLWKSSLSFFMKGKYMTHWTWHRRHQRDRERSRRFSFLISKICCLTTFFFLKKKNKVNENLSIRNHRRNIFVCKLFGHSHWLNMSNLFSPHSSHTDPPSGYIPDEEFFL